LLIEHNDEIAFWQYASLQLTGKPTNAVVINTQMDTTAANPLFRFRVAEVVFRKPEGKATISRLKISYHGNYKPKDVLPILYDPDKPANIMMNILPSEYLLFGLLNLLIACLIGGLPAINVLRLWKRYKLGASLQHHHKKTMATITRVQFRLRNRF